MSVTYLARLLAALDPLPPALTVDVSLSLPLGTLRPTQLVAKAVGRRAVFITLTGSTYKGRHQGRPEPLPTDPAVFARAVVALAQDAPRADWKAPNRPRAESVLARAGEVAW